VHAITQVWNRRAESQVKVISQQAKRVDFPAETRAGFTKRALKRLRGAHGVEKVAPVIAAIDDVIDRPWKLNSKPTCHCRKQTAQ
jgi:hypothetical protein